MKSGNIPVRSGVVHRRERIGLSPGSTEWNLEARSERELQRERPKARPGRAREAAVRTTDERVGGSDHRGEMKRDELRRARAGRTLLSACAVHRHAAAGLDHEPSERLLSILRGAAVWTSAESATSAADARAVTCT
jgi:hypothetical protein